MSREELKTEIEQKLIEKTAADPKLHNVYLLVHSNKLDIHWPMAAGNTDEAAAHSQQPYHIASVGKTFTSVLVSMLMEKQLLKFDDPIANYLPADLIKDLHHFKGKEYTYDIQVKHLLSHTSGIPDYYEDKPKQGKTMLAEILENPSQFWTPQETILWSKKHLQPHFPPGKGVHYTDTGYNLLGLIVENITSKPFHEVLHDYLFTPLQMNHTFLSQYSEPAHRSVHPVAHIYIDNLKIIVEKYRSFSSFYAGGQAVSTLEDQLLFMKALINHQLISKETLALMQQWNRLWIGMDYGYGLMRTRVIPFSQKYWGWGHFGASGTSMLYFPSLDVYIFGGFNQTTYRSKSMNFIFSNVLRKLAKLARP